MSNNVGALSKNKFRKRDRDPLLVGTLELDAALVEHLQFLIATEQDATLSLVAWNESFSDDESYFKIKALPEAVRLEPSDPNLDELDL